MKIKNLFLGSLACLAFAACSNDDDAVVNPSAKGEGQYMSVNIVNSVNSTRANTFTDGEGDETKVNDVILVFLKGNTILSVKEASLNDIADSNPENGDSDDWDGGNTSATVEKVSKAVVYLVPDATLGMPNGVIALLNSKAYDFTEGSIKALATKENLLKEIGDYDLNSNNFLMTNSVWSSNDGVTAISDGDFYETEAEAGNNPVNIYVERVLARVDVALNSTVTNEGTTKAVINADGTAANKLIVPEILGAHLAAASNNSYLIKHVSNWNFAGWEWQEPSLHRSYWALMPTSGVEPVYNVYSTKTALSTTPISFYTQENTSATNTELVVLVQHHVVENASDELTDANKLSELVYCNGMYYAGEEAYKTMLAEKLSAYFKSSEITDWSSIISGINRKDKVVTTGDIKQWEMVGIINTAATNLTNMSDVSVDLGGKTVQEYLQDWVNTEYTAWYWQGGKAYYHVKIKHDGIDATSAGEPNATVGVVRNHVYSLRINSIVGLGSPVYDPAGDPEDPIEPEDPTEEQTYIGASINVLQWRIVSSQDVELGN